MRKNFFVVDCITNEIVASVKIGAGGQVVYDNPPEFRKGVRLLMIGINCDIAMLALALTGYFIRPLFFILMPLASVAAAFGFILTCAGGWLERSAKKLSEGNQNKKRSLHNRYAQSVGPWKDPFGFAQGNINEIFGKRTYYIIDSETNAIMDVKCLGKWGQSYIEWRGKQRKRSNKEGGA